MSLHRSTVLPGGCNSTVVSPSPTIVTAWFRRAKRRVLGCLPESSSSDWVSCTSDLVCVAPVAAGDISSELYGDWLWDENFKFCLIFTHFSHFSPFSGYIWWNNTLSSLENFSLNSILFFLFLMSHPDNGGFLKIAQKRDSISKKTSFCIMVIKTDHQ